MNGICNWSISDRLAISIVCPALRRLLQFPRACAAGKHPTQPVQRASWWAVAVLDVAADATRQNHETILATGITQPFRTDSAGAIQHIQGKILKLLALLFQTRAESTH